MRCPYCGHERKPENAAFYKLPIEMKEEDTQKYDRFTCEVYGCPKCKKVFID